MARQSTYPVDLHSDAANANIAASGNNYYYNHQAINFTAAKEWYYFRINGVTAPSVAGRYFFKIALLSTGQQLATWR